MKRSGIFALVVSCGICLAPAWAQGADPSTTGQAAQYPADDSGRNVRDRQSDSLTASDQSGSPSDLALAQKIRQQVVADKSLSTMAQNVKIITVNGVVTLRGPVKDPNEKQRIAATASQIAGAENVHNDLEIAH